MNKFQWIIVTLMSAINSCLSLGPPSSTKSSWRRRSLCFVCWTRSGHRWRRIGAIIALIAAPAAKTRISTAVDPSSFAYRQNSLRKKRSTSMYSSTCGEKCASISRWTRARTSVSPPCRSMISWKASPSRCASGTNCRSICRTCISSRLSRGDCAEKHEPIIRQSSKRGKTFYFIESSDPTVRSRSLPDS